jgi:hypothetical protein
VCVVGCGGGREALVVADELVDEVAFFEGGLCVCVCVGRR